MAGAAWLCFEGLTNGSPWRRETAGRPLHETQRRSKLPPMLYWEGHHQSVRVEGHAPERIGPRATGIRQKDGQVGFESYTL